MEKIEAASVPRLIEEHIRRDADSYRPAVAVINEISRLGRLLRAEPDLLTAAEARYLLGLNPDSWSGGLREVPGKDLVEAGLEMRRLNKATGQTIFTESEINEMVLPAFGLEVEKCRK